MRDIRGDLQERATLVDEQIRNAYARFEEAVRQLQIERDERISALKADLTILEQFLDLEQRYSGKSVSERNVSPEIELSPEIKSPLLSLAELFLRRLKERGSMSKRELSEFAVQEGYFVDAEQALQGVHPMLVNLVRSEQIREVQNGVFASLNDPGFGNAANSDHSPSLTQVIKLRGAI
jgi:multidrug efflux pump subunit AcrA (membrane-fusion protein)